MYDFLYSTYCFGESPRVFCKAVVPSFDCYVIFHCVTLQQFICACYCSWIFGFAYNLELLEIVLVWTFWYVSFSAYLCRDFCWVYTQEWNCRVIGYMNVRFWEIMPNSFTKWLWSFIYSWQWLFFCFWQQKVEWEGFLMSYRFLGTKYLFKNTIWMSQV